MKALYIVLICVLLTGCGLPSEQITETAIAAQTQTQKAASTNTPSATPRPNLTATNQALRAATQTMQVFNARVKLTEFAMPTTTAIAKAGLILEEIQTAVNDVDKVDLSNAKLVFGPTNDTLTHVLANIVIVDDPRLIVKNFVATIKFVNPYDTSTTGQWDYGILFRNKYGSNQYRLIFLSNQSWTLYDAESDKYIYSSNDKNINPKAGEENTIWLIVIDEKAHLFINGIYAKTLDVSARLVNGDVSPATGLFYGNLKDRRITEYQDFTVWSLP
jgi:hypothetical protein